MRRCTEPCGKVRYETRRAARHASKAVRSKGDRMYVYDSVECGCYHLTSTNPTRSHWTLTTKNFQNKPRVRPVRTSKLPRVLATS